MSTAMKESATEEIGMSAIDRRTEFLADKYGLSAQLTKIWLQQNPKAKRPLLASELRALKAWARA